MKIKVKICVILMFLSANIFAQNLKKAFQLVENKKFDEAMEIFNKSVEKKKNIIVAKYGIALVLSDSTNPQRNLSRAFRQISSLKKSFPASLKEDKEIAEKEFSITEQIINETEEKIVQSAYSQAKNSVQGLNDFILGFNNASIIAEATQLRNEKAYQEASRENTPKAYREFFVQYPDAEQVIQAKLNYETSWREMYEKAASEGEYSTLKRFRDENPSYPFYEESFEKDEKLAQQGTFLELNRKFKPENAEKYDQYIRSAAPKELAFVVVQRLMETSIQTKNWNAAIDVLKKYQPFFPKDSRFDTLIKILQAPTQNVRVQEISNNINTETGNEYAPVLTANGKYLYFCGRDRTDNLGYEDIFVSINENGQFQKARLINGINSDFANEAPLCVSADGSLLVLFSEGDLYFSERTQNGWTEKRAFSINSMNFWDADATMAANGQAIIFTSEREGNVGNFHRFNSPFHGGNWGNLDLYISVKTAKGWSGPMNLGNTVNSPFAERSPFLHPDMKTLYFASDGHAGLGKLDIFKTTRLSDTSWALWSKPVNLGKEINSADNDFAYIISTDGEFAYFAKGGTNSYDIFMMDIPETAKPEEVSTVSGKIVDENGKPLETTIEWVDLEKNQIIGSAKSDISDGTYFIALPLGKNYGYYIKKSGYFGLSGNIDLRNTSKKVDLSQNFILNSEEVILSGKVSISLKNIFFDSGKYELKSSSFPELNRLIEFLNRFPGLKFEIAGHTDSQGDDESNRVLSENRAKSVLEYLVKNGCKRENLKAVGYGEKVPVSTNESDEGRANNRRVEFKVVK